MSWQDEQDIDLIRRKERLFWRNVTIISDFPEDCWLWNKSVSKNGYGLIELRRDENGKVIKTRSHRFSYLLLVGPIPDGLSCLHICDEPSCCNPLHLFLGTQYDNMQDKISKDRANYRQNYKATEETKQKMSESIRKAWLR